MGLDRSDVIDVESRIVIGEEDGQLPASAPAEAAEPAPVPVIVVETAMTRLDPIKQVLADLAKEIETTEFDITTTAGEEIARKLRQRCVAVRTGAKKLYTELNAPLLKVAKAWREQVAEIEKGVEPHESKLDALITAKDEARELEKQRKIAAEQKRIADIRAKISAIAALPAAAVRQDIVALDQAILDLQSQVITDESHGEFKDEAEVLRNETVTQLVEMLTAKKRDQAERDRMEIEAAGLRREQERQATERALRGKIDAIKAKAFDSIGKPAADIKKVLDAVIAAEPVALEFGDLHAEAATAWSGTRAMVEGALKAQQTVEQQQAEAAERQRIADAEAVERKRQLDEQEAEAARQREADAADLQRRQDAIAAEEKRLEETRNPPAPVIEAVTEQVQPGEEEQVSAPAGPEAEQALSMSMFASTADLEAARAEQAAQALPGPWLRTDNVVYRLVDGENFDQITVGVASGSLDILKRCALAQTLLEHLLRQGQSCKEIPV